MLIGKVTCLMFYNLKKLKPMFMILKVIANACIISHLILVVIVY